MRRRIEVDKGNVVREERGESVGEKEENRKTTREGSEN